MDLADVKAALANAPKAHGAAVLIPLLETDAGLQIVLEVRAHSLAVQPGEVCLPGGRIEADETPQEAAVRETCEELLVAPDQIELIGTLGQQQGPGGLPLHVYVGVLHRYTGTFSTDEVDRTFLLPLDWLLEHDPTIYEVPLTPSFPDDYPWDLMPEGRKYTWRRQVNRIPFYLGTDPLVWGATARVLNHFASVCRARRPSDA